jgi:hypothetical protein
MNKKWLLPVLCVNILIAGAGCIGSRFGSAKKKEKVLMSAPPKRDVINYALLKKQQEKPLTLASRGGSATRGAETAFAGSLVSLGVTAVKQVISNENKKYVATWKQGLSDLYFYDQPSAIGPFDPTGMQFNGFSITRTFEDDHQTMTAITADFEVDKDSVAANEIINDGIFRLKLKNIQVNYAKAKVPANKDTLNIDFNIVFVTSYVGRDGQLFKDVELGQFLLSLRKAPLDSNSNGYAAYYNKLKNKRLDGKCFLVPRSFGYYKTPDDSIVSLYNQGMFSIAVVVNECSRSSFVDRMLINTAGAGADLGEQIIMKGIKAKLGNN